MLIVLDLLLFDLLRTPKMRILPLSMLIVNVIFITDYTSAAMSFLAENEPDVTETVLYSKFQLWSATPNSNELRRTLLNIIRDYGRYFKD